MISCYHFGYSVLTDSYDTDKSYPMCHIGIKHAKFKNKIVSY